MRSRPDTDPAEEPYHATLEPERSEAPKSKGAVRLYRFYNWEQNKYGEPFALCDACRPKQLVPDECVLHVIANQALWSCAICGKTGQS
jgi:hypothetical protein